MQKKYEEIKLSKGQQGMRNQPLLKMKQVEGYINSWKSQVNHVCERVPSSGWLRESSITIINTGDGLLRRKGLALLTGGSSPGLIDVTTFSTWWWELAVEQNF